MSVSGIEITDYPIARDGTRKTERNVVGGNFAKQVEEAAQTTGQTSTAILHGSDEKMGDIAICSGVDILNNSSITVYKTQDFDPGNPVYKVKTWDKDGNVTERMIDVSKVDPKSSDTAEMYAYTSNLKQSGKGSFEDTVLKAAVAKAVKNAEQRSSGSWSFSTKMNWVDIVKDIMQMQYNAGNLEGYLHYKRFWDFLGK